MTVISFDIGTTKICAIAVEAETGELLEILTDSNISIESANSMERVQDPKAIIAVIDKQLSVLYAKYRPISCIGVTGQMHGIVYTDIQGKAVSLLYTWQDESANAEYKNGYSYADYLSSVSNYKMASGYGLTTCFYHTLRGMIPSEAARICTIQDYIVMHLTGSKIPLIHASNAAGLGMFDIVKGCFDRLAVIRSGIDPDLLPDVTMKNETAGETDAGIPVCVAIGDNQASYIGSVDNTETCVHVNIGTGSQISIAVNMPYCNTSLDLRPFTEGYYLLTGSPLCGGRAFAVLEEFFRSVLEMAGITDSKTLYPAMDKLLETAELNHLKNPLKVDTKFCGTRENPNERGHIENIGIDNLTPVDMMTGFLDGIAQELYDMISPILSMEDFRRCRLIASGNGIRRNPALRRILSKKFNMPLQIPLHEEEAAYGAALFALETVKGTSLLMPGIKKYHGYIT